MVFAAYLPLFLAFVFAVALAAGVLLLSSWLGPRRPSAIKAAAFECGNDSSGSARYRFNVQFFLVAILFLVFDVEAVFIYPWAVAFNEATQAGSALAPGVVLAEMGVFVAVIVVALAYAWRKGALEWGPRRE